MKEGEGDNADFKIGNGIVQARVQFTEAGTKNITVIVTDSNNVSKEASAEIVIAGEE